MKEISILRKWPSIKYVSLFSAIFDPPASRVVAYARPGQDGGLCDAVGVPVGKVAVERRLGLHRHRDGGEGGTTVRPAGSPAARADVEGVLEAPPHVVLLAAVDHKAEEECEKNVDWKTIAHR